MKYNVNSSYGQCNIIVVITHNAIVV